MIVSDEKRFIYVRIPKTASTSVSAALEPYRRMADRSFVGRIGRRLSPNSTHPALTDFRAHSHWGLQAAREVLGEHFFQSVYRFSVVRHPVARARSLYSHVMRHRSDPAFGRVFAEVYAAYGEQAHTNLDPFVDWLARNRLAPQATLLVDYEGNVLADAVARVENLEEEIAPIFGRLELNVEILRLNIGDERAQVQVSDQARSTLRDIFAVDYELFGYGENDTMIASPALVATASTRALGNSLARAGGARDFRPWQPLPRL